MSSNSLITGIGLCTALGNSAVSTWTTLCAGQFIADHARVPQLDGPGRPRVNTLALRVAREALTAAGWKSGDLRQAALVVGTSKGPVDAWLEAMGTSTPAGESGPIFGLGETAAVVAAEFNIRGPRLTLSAACASGLVALIRAAMMIRSGEAKRALVVATESSLHPLFLGSFKRLGVLSPDGHGCRPFDEQRSGFVVSEAAAAICLESKENREDDSKAIATIDRFALGADATHLTGGDPNGVILRHVLRQVCDGRSLDLIHAHGTGTIANDPIELAAIESCLSLPGGQPASLYSHKGALGHSLGAAGLLALAINCLCHRHGMIPPNVQTRAPLKTEGVEIHQSGQRRQIRRSMAIAAGFGGAVAAVSIVNPNA